MRLVHIVNEAEVAVHIHHFKQAGVAPAVLQQHQTKPLVRVLKTQMATKPTVLVPRVLRLRAYCLLTTEQVLQTLSRSNVCPALVLDNRQPLLTVHLPNTAIVSLLAVIVPQDALPVHAKVAMLVPTHLYVAQAAAILVDV